ncbi:MAG: hypothetical protein JXA54_13620 [Candidatus Heimdallarchaeota archaeon]|nr:hypothetical protein [Candidatus Heimdallarchaeota archaeon]
MSTTGNEGYEKQTSDNGRICIEADYVYNPEKKPMVLSISYKENGIVKPFNQIIREEIEGFYQSKSDIKLKEIIKEYCDLTYKFFNKDFTIGTQHTLFEIIQHEHKNLPYREYFSFLKNILNFIRKWEEENKNTYLMGFQKGSGYFWLAEGHFQQRLFDLGFQYLAQAIEEDRKFIPTRYQNQGGFLAASLVHEKIEAGYIISHNLDSLKPITNKLNSIFQNYTKNYNNSFTYHDLVTKFLLNNDSDIEFYKLCFTRAFAYICDYLLNYDDYHFSNNVMSATMLPHIFNLLVLFEELIKLPYTRSGSNFPGLTEVIMDLIPNSWLSLNDKNKIKSDYVKGWENDTSNFNSKLRDAINLSFAYSRVTILDKKASVLLSAWVLRNLTAHRILKRILDNKTELNTVLETICYALFMMIDRL